MSLLALVWLLVLVPCYAQPLDAFLKTEDGSDVPYAAVPGFSRWSAPRHLFTSSVIIVECSGRKDFGVFIERTEEGLRAAVEARDRAWCGWAHALGNNRAQCFVPVSPFGDTLVAVRERSRPAIAGLLGAGRADELAPCTATRRDRLSLARLAAAGAGAALFWWAPALARSTPFRLTSGTAFFVVFSVLFFLAMVYRAFPHKKRLAALAGLLGSGFWAAVRFTCGTWLPALHQLARNPLVIAYVGLSAVTGLVVTYWFNDAANPKVDTVLRVGLQAGGLALVAAAASLPEGSAALALALALGRWGGGLARRLPASTPGPPAPWVAQGKVLNVETGHLIGVGKGTYNRLLVEGYVLDEQQGTLTPPPGKKAPGSASRSGTSSRRRR
ncbi:hypothetical protein QBZ16_003906 [Prototheca wickerhamii]|uniref:Uncharacterized protein n=1 Tax=Prototheca wickerhamii TaxID=3111 RepID=A0AAD9IGV0_PROWI|nr:hypothetical protein QBZ16_003906 [Prototheca wickerhamii]